MTTALALETHALDIGYCPPRRAPVTVARQISVRLPAGTLTCLIGPNGAGKSTLMRTLAGMQPALAGRVMLAGVPLESLTAQQRAQRLGIVLTERPNLGLLSGAGLVALGRHPHTRWHGTLSRYDEAVIRWAIDAVDAADLADRPVMELSDGQRQRLMIARVLAQETDVIVLDEPTAFLDLPRRVEMLHLLRHLAHQTGRAVLLSTHELDLALRTADDIWLMAGGQVVTGAPEDLVLDGAFERAFAGEGVVFDRQTGAFRIEGDVRGALVMTGAVDSLGGIWARRALERAGYQVLVDGPAHLPRVEVLPTGWRLCPPAGGIMTFERLADVLAALRPV